MDWKARYEQLQQYVKKLELENRKLRRQLELANNISTSETAVQQEVAPANESQDVNQNSSPIDKIQLFRNIFRGREDIYAKRWYNFKKAKSGYAPAYECDNVFGFGELVIDNVEKVVYG